MNTRDEKIKYGFCDAEFEIFCKKNPNIPKGTFQVKKRGSSYYWYYTLSTNTTDRVKYLSKAYENLNKEEASSFILALSKLKEKYTNDVEDLHSGAPEGNLSDLWTSHKFNMKLVNPANKRKYTVIVVGTGLAGASAAATMAELGYNVLAFSFHESPRRAHSIAAQGGINAVPGVHPPVGQVGGLRDEQAGPPVDRGGTRGGPRLCEGQRLGPAGGEQPGGAARVGAEGAGRQGELPGQRPGPGRELGVACIQLRRAREARV